jgi:hypothetical protein
MKKAVGTLREATKGQTEIASKTEGSDQEAHRRLRREEELVWSEHSTEASHQQVQTPSE